MRYDLEFLKEAGAKVGGFAWGRVFLALVSACLWSGVLFGMVWVFLGVCFRGVLEFSFLVGLPLAQSAKRLPQKKNNLDISSRPPHNRLNELCLETNAQLLA